MAQHTCACGLPSVLGVKIPLCHYHFDRKMYGKLLADWMHGYARCVSCTIPLDAAQGVYRRTPMCQKCDTRIYNNSEA